MEGPWPPADFVSDGCSCVADFLIAVDCRPGCHWHDYAYHLGGDWKDRWKADAVFYRNLRACDVGKLFATMRYLGVRVFGGSRFTWEPKTK